MNYLYERVQKKLEELMSKSPKAELDMDTLKKDFPRRMKLNRYDVINIVRELENDGVLVRHGNKITKR